MSCFTKRNVKIISSIFLLLLIYITNIYLVTHFFVSQNIYFGIQYISMENLKYRFAMDISYVLPILFCLFLFHHRYQESFYLRIKCPVVCVILIGVLVSFFIVNEDFSFCGLYLVFFNLIITGLFEELLFRGFIYNMFRKISIMLAIILGGALFGAVHAILPTLLQRKGVNEMLMSMAGLSIWGIWQGGIFTYLMVRSNTLHVPILVHTVENYSYDCSLSEWGTGISYLCIMYFLIKDIYNNRKKIIKFIKNGGIEREYIEMDISNKR